MVEGYSIPANSKRGGHFYTYILMAYFLLAPFEDLLSFDGGTLGKWLAVLVVIVGIYEAGGHIRLRFHEGNFCLICLMLISFLSCFWAIEPDVALERNIAYLTLPAFYLFVSAMDFSQREYDQIIQAAILGGVLVSVYILLSGYAAATGRLSLQKDNDPNNMAALLQLPLAMSFQQAIRKQTRCRLLYTLSFLLILFVLLMTGSRGGMVSAAVLFLAFFLLSKAYKKAGVFVSLLVLLIIILQFVLPALPEEISARLFETDYNAEMESGSRARIWRVVFRGLLPQMPAYGVGAGCAPYALTTWFTHVNGVHNTYLCMICEYGLLGIGPFLWFLLAKLKKQIMLNHYAEAALLLAIYVTIFFLDAYAKKFFWNVMLLTIIAVNTQKYKECSTVCVESVEKQRKEENP